MRISDWSFRRVLFRSSRLPIYASTVSEAFSDMDSTTEESLLLFQYIPYLVTLGSGQRFHFSNTRYLPGPGSTRMTAVGFTISSSSKKDRQSVGCSSLEPAHIRMHGIRMRSSGVITVENTCVP